MKEVISDLSPQSLTRDDILVPVDELVGIEVGVDEPLDVFGIVLDEGLWEHVLDPRRH